MKTLFFAALLTFGFAACAQTKYVQKTYAFVELHMPGNIRASDDLVGNGSTDGPYKVHFIYVELAKGVAPIWQNAVIDGSRYTVNPTQVEKTPLEVGQQKNTNKMVVITPKPGNVLWKLELDLMENEKRADLEKVASSVVLKGTYKNQKINCTVGKEVELNVLPAY